MKVQRSFGLNLRTLACAVAVMSSASATNAYAEADYRGLGAAMKEHHAPQTTDKQSNSAFVAVVRDATRRYRDVAQAIADGYQLQFGCVTGSHEGAMGLHYVNGDLVGDPALDPARPELLVYEPLPNGRVRLVAVDYLVFKDAWDASHSDTPKLMGQLFHLFDTPNRYGLPAFYTLHVWAWKSNPSGTFANWNPNVSCDAYDETTM